MLRGGWTDEVGRVETGKLQAFKSISRLDDATVLSEDADEVATHIPGSFERDLSE